MTPPLWRWPGLVLTGALIVLIRVYQLTLSPLLAAFGPVCRFEPSCSRYMIGALRKYGLIKGLWKGTGRVLRCHPWHPGGYDPPRPAARRVRGDRAVVPTMRRLHRTWDLFAAYTFSNNKNSARLAICQRIKVSLASAW